MPKVSPKDRENHPKFAQLPLKYKKVLTAETCLFHGVPVDEINEIEILCLDLPEGTVIWHEGSIFYDANFDFLRVIASGSVSVIYQWANGENKEIIEVAKYGPCFVIGELESYIGYDVSLRPKNKGIMVDYRNKSGRVDYRSLPYTLQTNEPTTILLVNNFFSQFHNNPQVLLNLVGIISTKHLLMPEHLIGHFYKSSPTISSTNPSNSRTGNLSEHHAKVAADSILARQERFYSKYIPIIITYCLKNDHIKSSSQLDISLEEYRSMWFNLGKIPLKDLSVSKAVNPYDQPSRDMKYSAIYYIHYGHDPLFKEKRGTKLFYVQGEFLLKNSSLNNLVPIRAMSEWKQSKEK